MPENDSKNVLDMVNVVMEILQLEGYTGSKTCAVVVISLKDVLYANEDSHLVMVVLSMGKVVD